MDRGGLEPPTSRLKVWRSTTELAILIVEQSAGLEPVFTSLEGSGPTLRPRLRYMAFLVVCLVARDNQPSIRFVCCLARFEPLPHCCAVFRRLHVERLCKIRP